MSEGEDGQRIDTWLWHARFFKTRSLATAVVAKGRVRLTRFGQTRRITKASATVRAASSLPVPVSPWISTSTSSEASCATCARSALAGPESPMKRVSIDAEAPTASRSRSTSRFSRRCATARSSTATRWSAS